MVYRADIDGLRAISILLILLYHGGLSLFPSGFIGVDIFFVISGFLITQIIHHALENNNFSFVEFYSRRIWRLQPVFVCLIVFTTLLAFLLFLPEDLIDFSRSARKTSLFISNLFFNQVAGGYFSPDTHQLPLLHTWSLAIEWQYYLLLPAMMYGLHYFFTKKNLKIVIFLLTVICSVCSLFLFKKYADSSYYFFFNRLFEFLLGSCVALLPIKNYPMNRLVGNLLGSMALLSILYIATLKGILPAYPNGYAMFVCLSTAFLIAFTTFFPNPWHSKLLSFRPLVFIGLLSYSLYIWHWVIFSFLRYEGIPETPTTLIFAYGVTFIVSYISWRWIEKPTRKLRPKFYYTFILLLLFPITFTHIMHYFIHKNSGYPQRFSQELSQIYERLTKWSSEQRPLCISHKETNLAQCKIGSKTSHAKSAILIGDSFSNHYWGFIDVLGKDANLSVLAQGTSSCLALPGIYLYDWWKFNNSVYQECHEQTQKYYQMIRANHYDYVIIGQLWNNYYSNNVINQLGDQRSLDLTKQRIKNALDNALHQITSSGAKPVIIETMVVMPAKIHDCFFKHIKKREPYDSNRCSFNSNLGEDGIWFRQLFSEMKIKYPELILVDPSKLQCSNGKCLADIDGVPIYRDKGHLTDYASYQFGYLYLKSFPNPFESSDVYSQQSSFRQGVIE